MNGLAKFAPLSGLAFVILLAAGALVVDNYEYLPPPEEIRSLYEGSPTRIMVGAYLVMLSTFFLVWFAGSLRSFLRHAEGGTGRLSAVAFGGGVAAAAMLALGYAAMFAAAARAGSDAGVAAETATALHDFWSAALGQGAGFAFAVTVGASAVVSFRTNAFAGWLSWVSAILAVGLLSPYNYIFVGFGVLWVAVVSVILYVSGRAPVRTSSSA